jgi:hypothetical protein
MPQLGLAHTKTAQLSCLDPIPVAGNSDEMVVGTVGRGVVRVRSSRAEWHTWAVRFLKPLQAKVNVPSRAIQAAEALLKSWEDEAPREDSDGRKFQQEHIKIYRRHLAGLRAKRDKERGGKQADRTALTVYGLPIKGGNNNPNREHTWMISARDWQNSSDEPIKLSSSDFVEDLSANSFELWVFEGNAYLAQDPDLTSTDVFALIRQESNTRRLALEKAHALQAMAEQLDTPRQRERITQEVRIEVWQRDFGRCVDCGSQENLEFDHIIPFAMGGSSTARNLQLLCGSCNRRKGMTLG